MENGFPTRSTQDHSDYIQPPECPTAIAGQDCRVAASARGAALRVETIQHSGQIGCSGPLVHEGRALRPCIRVRVAGRAMGDGDARVQGSLVTSTRLRLMRKARDAMDAPRRGIAMGLLER